MINTDDIKVGDIFSTYTKLVSALGKDSDKLQSAVSEYYARLEEIKKDDLVLTVGAGDVVKVGELLLNS